MTPTTGTWFSILGAVDVAAALAACRKALVSTRGAVDMAAALAGYRKALVGTGWTISHLVSINRLRNHSPSLVTISGLIGSIQSCGTHAGRRALTIANEWVSRLFC